MNKSLVALPILLLALTAFFIANRDNAEFKPKTQFEKWKQTFSMHYGSELQSMYRQRVFLENVKKIQQHNANPSRTYDMGINQFSAMTKEEFIERYLTIPPRPSSIFTFVTQNAIPSNEDIDWTTKGAVTPAKNQGQCGAVWAFSCIGALEGLSKIAYGTLKTFSQQQLIDCSNPYGAHGCNGGLPSNAYAYVRDHGICQEQSYPYKGTVQACKNCTNPFKISSYTEVKDCSALTEAIMKQPVSVTVDATNWATYRSGIFSNCSTRLNHAGVLVGLINGAWKVKNSWGAAWGENGFIRLANGNTCGICMAAIYPNK